MVCCKASVLPFRYMKVYSFHTLGEAGSSVFAKLQGFLPLLKYYYSTTWFSNITRIYINFRNLFICFSMFELKNIF